MIDCISRQAVLSMQYRIDDSATLSTRDVVSVDDIEDLPSVTPQQKTGHWIEHEIEDTCRWLTCSVCGYEWVNKKENFCPNCRTKMQEVEE